MSQTVVVSRASGYDRITFALAGGFGIPKPQFEWRSECLGKDFCDFHVLRDGRVIHKPYYDVVVQASNVLTAILNGTLNLNHVLVHGIDQDGERRTFKLRIVNNFVVEIVEGDTVIYKQAPRPADLTFIGEKIRQFNTGIKKVRDLLRVRPKR